jgi:hypothetical protein
MEKLHASVGGSKTLPLKISSNETINKILDLKRELISLQKSCSK